MEVHVGAVGERQRHRRATRPGGHDGMNKTVEHPLVDERRAERSLHIGDGFRLGQPRRACRIMNRHGQHDTALLWAVMRTTLEVEIWSDVVCPWCYIGKRRFERALAEVADEIDVDIVYRPYQLDPTALPGAATPVSEAYAKKFGGAERATQIIAHVTEVAAADGISFHMDRALRANTLLAHRLLWFAEQTGGQHEVKERLLRAYFEDGLDIGDPDVLADCAADAGLDRSTVRAFLDTADGLAEVRAFIAHAQDNGITAVPTFVLSDTASSTAWMVPGAQDTDVFVRVLRRLAARATASDTSSDTNG